MGTFFPGPTCCHICGPGDAMFQWGLGDTRDPIFLVCARKRETGFGGDDSVIRVITMALT